MQIAQIVVKTRTTKEDIFDYEIPPEILAGIKIGSLVEVPFRNRTLIGIVVGLKRRSDLKLKKISALIDPEPVVDDVHIKLAKWMSEYYLGSLGQTLFENVVPPAIRTLKKLHEQQAPSRIYARAEILDDFSFKKYLVIADFNSRLQFYLKKIAETLEQKRSVIILVPDLSMIDYFKRSLDYQLTVLHANMTKTQRWLAWNQIRQGENLIVIGSQSALFAPVKNLGLIIIDQEESETYKNDRTPRFQALDVVYRLSALAGARLIVGSISPRTETYWSARSAKFKIMRKSEKLQNCTVVNMAAEKSIISSTLEQKIKENLQNNRKIILVLNRKGEGTKYSCADCGWIETCQECGLPLVPKEDTSSCSRCEKTYPQTRACPKCSGLNLKPTGLGTLKLKKILQKIYPESKIIIIEKDSNALKDRDDWEIAIVTSYALKMQFSLIGLVAIMDADQNLNLPDFSSIQKSFETYYKFLKLGSEKLIQTHHVDHYLIKSLASLDNKGFLKRELRMRKNERFPPFYQLTRLEHQNIDLLTAEKESLKVYQSLSASNRRSFDISKPFQPYIQKKHDKFRYQIIIKHQKIFGKNTLNSELKDKIKSLPKGWIVDVDPFSLM